MSEIKTITIIEAVVNFLQESDQKIVFGYKNAPVSPLQTYLKFNPDSDLSYLLAEEDSDELFHLIDSYYRETNKTPVIFTTTKCSLIDLLGTLKKTTFNGIPVLCLCGESHIKPYSQIFGDDVDLYRTQRCCVKHSIELNNVDKLPKELNSLYELIHHEQNGAAILHIPLSLQRDFVMNDVRSSNKNKFPAHRQVFGGLNKDRKINIDIAVSDICQKAQPLLFLQGISRYTAKESLHCIQEFIDIVNINTISDISSLPFLDKESFNFIGTTEELIYGLEKSYSCDNTLNSCISEAAEAYQDSELIIYINFTDNKILQNHICNVQGKSILIANRNCVVYNYNNKQNIIKSKICDFVKGLIDDLDNRKDKIESLKSEGYFKGVRNTQINDWASDSLIKKQNVLELINDSNKDSNKNLFFVGLSNDLIYLLNDINFNKTDSFIFHNQNSFFTKLKGFLELGRLQKENDSFDRKIILLDSATLTNNLSELNRFIYYYLSSSNKENIDFYIINDIFYQQLHSLEVDLDGINKNVSNELINIKKPNIALLLKSFGIKPETFTQKMQTESFIQNVKNVDVENKIRFFEFKTLRDDIILNCKI